MLICTNSNIRIYILRNVLIFWETQNLFSLCHLTGWLNPLVSTTLTTSHTMTGQL